MTKKSHQLIAVIASIALNLPVIPALVASTLPDVDVKWQKKNGGLLFSHRGITHHLILTAVLISSIFFIKLPEQWNAMYTSFVVGYVSHVLADIMTISGVPYWTNKDRVSLKLFKTGSIQETVFVLALSSMIVGIIVYKEGVWSIIPYEVKLVVLFLHSLTG